MPRRARTNSRFEMQKPTKKHTVLMIKDFLRCKNNIGEDKWPKRVIEPLEAVAYFIKKYHVSKMRKMTGNANFKASLNSLQNLKTKFVLIIKFPLFCFSPVWDWHCLVVMTWTGCCHIYKRDSTSHAYMVHATSVNSYDYIIIS